ncbi:hypothetical protein EVAR_48085_1 [Eumeta japonica]|uniref:Mos1 transposase HTH domain-containing protein n=1 Tax=Eumeta variegata TaxID=151549 RepID=A0A4C1XNJ1_EUMVA|nr:hypothetical protein EVAR_48085_1 [Eumeta japonica]
MAAYLNRVTDWVRFHQCPTALLRFGTDLDIGEAMGAQQSLARLRTAFDNKEPFETTTYNWFAKFKRGRVSLSDEFRDGRPSTAVNNNKSIDVVRRMNETDSYDDRQASARYYGAVRRQGQTIKVAGIHLGAQCFSHGQLYVACSRISKSQNLHVYTD